MTMQGEIKPGYKRTEVGVIPEDWEVVEAFDLEPFITSGSRGWAQYYSDRGALFLRITNLSRTWLYPDLSDRKLVDIPKGDTEGQRTSLQDGDILISITADIGVVGYVGPEIPKPAYINQHIACLRLPESKTDSLFQSYYLASHGPQKRFMEMTDIGAKSGINLTTIGKLKLIRPPLLEQRAIAAALADADALIRALEGMTAKKRDLKQAAMQHLLTGKTRLPRFSGEWEVKRLGEVAGITKGAQLHSSRMTSSGRFPHYNGGVAPSGYTGEANCAAGTVAISEGGNSCGFVNYITTPFWCGGHCYALSFHRDDKLFLYQYLKLRQSDIMGLRVGSGLPNVQKTALANFPVTLPIDIAEQTAIAEVLSDMDADLAALEAQVAKARAVKQGMMQELLTGRVRLV